MRGEEEEEEEEEASEHRQGERDTEAANKVKVTPGVTVGSLRRLRTTLHWTDPRTPGAVSAVQIGSLKNLRVRGS